AGGGIARAFFQTLLAWLTQERDLQGLLNKVATDRTLKFVDRKEGSLETAEELRQRRERRQGWLAWGNIFGPPVVLLLFGLGVLLRRRTQKRAFLARI